MELRGIRLRTNQGAMKGHQGRGKGRMNMDTGGGRAPATHIRPPCRPLLGRRRGHEGDRRVSPSVARFQVRVSVQAQATKRSRVTQCSRHILPMGSHNNLRSRKRRLWHICAPHRDNTNTRLSLLHMRRHLQDLRTFTVARNFRCSHNQWPNLRDRRELLYLLHVLHLSGPRLSDPVPRSAHGHIRPRGLGSGPLEVIFPRAMMTVTMTRSLNGYLVWTIVVVQVALRVLALVGVQGRANSEDLAEG